MRYIIVFLIEGNLKTKLDNLRKDISKKFNVSEALKYPTHMTLKGPFETNNIGPVEDFLQEYTDQCKSFTLKLNNFGHFKSRTCFVNISKSSKLTKIRNKVIDTTIKLLNLPSDPKDHLIPHITLAYKDVTPETFEKIKNYLKDKQIKENVDFNNITILQYSANKWIIHKKFRLRVD